jgi:hypothetical protein
MGARGIGLKVTSLDMIIRFHIGCSVLSLLAYDLYSITCPIVVHSHSDVHGRTPSGNKSPGQLRSASELSLASQLLQFPQGEEMTNLTSVVKQLQQERTRAAREVDRLDAALAALNGSHRVRTGGRGRLSAAARARIAATQRARWAKARAGAGAKATIVSPKKRILSAAARKRIAAAQRARWAKFKAAKGKKAA